MTRVGPHVGCAIGCAALAGCTSFADPDIVVDLRVLAMTASLPEQIIDIDVDNPPEQPTELLQQLMPSEVCALVADPADQRRLRYSLTLCPFGEDNRCDPVIEVPIGSGVVEDPETSASSMCGTVNPTIDLLTVVMHALENDELSGLGGIDYLVSFRVGGELDDPSNDQFAAKTLRVAPRIPAERLANNNPTLDRIDVVFDGSGDDTALPLTLGRCQDQTAPLQVAPRQRLKLIPIEPSDAREPYVVPTLDGSSRMFTESLTYQWRAGRGSFSSGSTGGPRDISGNPAPLFTEWTAPRAQDLEGITDVPLWIVQRDERLGARWYESCIRVAP
ncbi:MAG: hypothetical protein AB7O24_03265 [Kofleriaceae bacterium]